MDIETVSGVVSRRLVDIDGRFSPERLGLKQLQPDFIWQDEQDADGEKTSRLGFCIVLDSDIGYGASIRLRAENMHGRMRQRPAFAPTKRNWLG